MCNKANSSVLHMNYRQVTLCTHDHITNLYLQKITALRKVLLEDKISSSARFTDRKTNISPVEYLSHCRISILHKKTRLSYIYLSTLKIFWTNISLPYRFPSVGKKKPRSIWTIMIIRSILILVSVLPKSKSSTIK